jgi:hypothetical protein
MKRAYARLWALGLVLLMLPIAAYGQAGLPKENHYKVYNTSPVSFTRPLILTDQFGAMNANVFRLEKFANPTEKIHDGAIYPMDDPLAHQTWWRIVDALPQPARTVIGIDQFGYGPVTVGDPVYLLNPALKNPGPGGGTPPIRNHYLCYEVLGSLPIYKLVILIDQFGTSDVTVVRSKLFCNPVEKREGAVYYPILDYRAHLQCYEVQNPQPNFHPVVAFDQFGYWQIETYQNDCLCVPALKEHIVSTERTTWGQIKALYR